MAKKLVLPTRYGFDRKREIVKVDDLVPELPEQELEVEKFEPVRTRIVRPVSPERGREILMAERFGTAVPRVHPR